VISDCFLICFVDDQKRTTLDRNDWSSSQSDWIYHAEKKPCTHWSKMGYPTTRLDVRAKMKNSLLHKSSFLFVTLPVSLPHFLHIAQLKQQLWSQLSIWLLAALKQKRHCNFLLIPALGYWQTKVHFSLPVFRFVSCSYDRSRFRVLVFFLMLLY
jgi:hypothetical protein